MNKEKIKTIMWEDVKDELEAVVATRNDEYNKSFNDARKATIRPIVDGYVAQHKDATQEEVKQFVEDYLAQTPDEFQRNLRTYCSTMGALWNMMNAVRVEVAELKDIYVACNDQKIQAFAKKQASLIRKAKEAEQENADNVTNIADHKE